MCFLYCPETEEFCCIVFEYVGYSHDTVFPRLVVVPGPQKMFSISAGMSEKSKRKFATVLTFINLAEALTFNSVVIAEDKTRFR